MSHKGSLAFVVKFVNDVVLLCIKKGKMEEAGKIPHLCATSVRFERFTYTTCSTANWARSPPKRSAEAVISRYPDALI